MGNNPRYSTERSTDGNTTREDEKKHDGLRSCNIHWIGISEEKKKTERIKESNLKGDR